MFKKFAKILLDSIAIFLCMEEGSLRDGIAISSAEM